MECIVHFEIMHGDEPKQLRGLIIVGKGEQPGEEKFVQMFARMGYKVRLDDAEQLIFKPLDPSADYRWIRIREVDSGQEKTKDDHDLNSIVANLLPDRNRPI
ncbi:hypothetical protein [Saccharibacillus endophyticus]|uniref:Uncharacterized protein n=1 Tax=Saccharibacillus endophyticus TaxID=2060666 RepID=A0ABQ1ZXB2_9BACL|nr:hypothetical protein [Saccharibacillus endophyticus]GGH81610.1 hypothetical protein GCM10007362_31670 [Saccharibacillus endophyticus]